jgi:hypothetical protein
MFSPKSIRALLAVVALGGVMPVAHADAESATETVVVTATHVSCEGTSPREARRLAKEAEHNGAHRQAADCFRVAGDHLRADRAMIRVTAETSADTKQKLAANAETVKAQARRLREAFR